MAKPGKEGAAVASGSVGGSQCLAAGCTQRPARAEFCDEHFKWFKVGLITVRGERAKDFDKKMQQSSRLLDLF